MFREEKPILFAGPSATAYQPPSFFSSAFAGLNSAGPGEESDDSARLAEAVAIIKVVASRVIEVDG